MNIPKAVIVTPEQTYILDQEDKKYPVHDYHIDYANVSDVVVIRRGNFDDVSE